jgi:hypothetical protein
MSVIFNGSAPKVDLGDLADRCLVAGNAVEQNPADAELFGACAEALRAAKSVIDTVPDVVQQNRLHQYRVTCEGVVEALYSVAAEYESGTRTAATPQYALRMFASALRDSLQPKPKKTIVS